MTELLIYEENPEHSARNVTLTNDEWLVVSQAMESFADTYRTRHSQVVTTYVTRGQLEEAKNEADKMNQLLQRLDKIQASLL